MAAKEHDSIRQPIPQSKTIADSIMNTGASNRAQYLVKEVFYSIQGEGLLAGTPMLFVRFGGCNLRCSKSNAGFDCDTDFNDGAEWWDRDRLSWAIVDAVLDNGIKWVLFTGGEPMLTLGAQRGHDLIVETNLKMPAGYSIKYAIETNGTVDMSNLSYRLNHICVSPKSAPETIQQTECNEVKFVLRKGQPLMYDPTVKDNKPRFTGRSNGLSAQVLVSPADASPENIAWCVEQVKANPFARLSIQQHRVHNWR